MARVRFPDPTSYVGWVCCFCTLLWAVFPRVLRFILSSKPISLYIVPNEYRSVRWRDTWIKFLSFIVVCLIGADGGLDFGVLKVLDETKQTCSLKNKGKFEISFNFAFESTDGSPLDIGQLFTVIPNRGPLMPTDRPTQVQVIFRSKSEVTIKDQPVLKCQVNLTCGFYSLSVAVEFIIHLLHLLVPRTYRNFNRDQLEFFLVSSIRIQSARLHFKVCGGSWWSTWSQAKNSEIRKKQQILCYVTTSCNSYLSFVPSKLSGCSHNSMESR